MNEQNYKNILIISIGEANGPIDFKTILEGLSGIKVVDGKIMNTEVIEGLTLTEVKYTHDEPKDVIQQSDLNDYTFISETDVNYLRELIRTMWEPTAPDATCLEPRHARFTIDQIAEELNPAFDVNLRCLERALLLEGFHRGLPSAETVFKVKLHDEPAPVITSPATPLKVQLPDTKEGLEALKKKTKAKKYNAKYADKLTPELEKELEATLAEIAAKQQSLNLED